MNTESGALNEFSTIQIQNMKAICEKEAAKTQKTTTKGGRQYVYIVRDGNGKHLKFGKLKFFEAIKTFFCGGFFTRKLEKQTKALICKAETMPDSLKSLQKTFLNIRKTANVAQTHTINFEEPEEQEGGVTENKKTVLSDNTNPKEEHVSNTNTISEPTVPKIPNYFPPPLVYTPREPDIAEAKKQVLMQQINKSSYADCKIIKLQLETGKTFKEDAELSKKVFTLDMNHDPVKFTETELKRLFIPLLRSDQIDKDVEAILKAFPNGIKKDDVECMFHVAKLDHYLRTAKTQLKEFTEKFMNDMKLQNRPISDVSPPTINQNDSDRKEIYDSVSKLLEEKQCYIGSNIFEKLFSPLIQEGDGRAIINHHFDNNPGKLDLSDIAGLLGISKDSLKQYLEKFQQTEKERIETNTKSREQVASQNRDISQILPPKIDKNDEDAKNFITQLLTEGKATFYKDRFTRVFSPLMQEQNVKTVIEDMFMHVRDGREMPVRAITKLLGISEDSLKTYLKNCK